MGDNTPAKEGTDAPPGAVDELVGNDNMAGRNLLFQTAHRPHGNQAPRAQLFHPIDIGAEIQLGGQDSVATAMTRQENHANAVELANKIVIRRRAKRRLNAHPLAVLNAVHLIQTAATNNTQRHHTILLSYAACSRGAASCPQAACTS